MAALLGRHYLWLCAVFIAGGQISSRAQPFLVAQRSPGIPTDSGLVALGWNPSPDTNATGYFLCWGLASDACTNRLDVGNSTNTSVSGLATGMAYYFSVVAYGAAGQEGPPSNEISYTLSSAAITLLVTHVLLSADSNGQALTPDLTGTNFALAVDTCGSSVVLTQSVAAGTVLALGTNQVVLTLTDGCGNAAYATNFVIVQDTTPPVLSKGTISTWYATQAAAEAAALAATSASDNCTPAAQLTTNVSTIGSSNATVTVSATDGCGNTASVSYDTHIDNKPPIIQTLPQAGGMLSLTWSALVGQQFQVQYKTNWIQADWINLGDPIPATATTMTASAAISPDPQRFYRVLIVP